MNDHYFTNTKEGFIEILSINEICVMLKEKFNRLNEQNKNLKKQLKEIKNERWKDKELQQMTIIKNNSIGKFDNKLLVFTSGLNYSLNKRNKSYNFLKNIQTKT